MRGFVANAQAPLIQWQKSFGGTSLDSPKSIRATKDGGYIVTGSTKSINGDVVGQHGGADYWVIKITGTGAVEWKKNYGGSANDYPSCIQQTKDNGYIICGYTLSTNGDVTNNHGMEDCWVVRLDSGGTLQWQKTYGGTSVEKAEYIIETFDGGYVFAGKTSSTNGDVVPSYGNGDYWIVKISSNGNIEWAKSYGGYATDFSSCIKQTADSGYIVTGTSYSSDGDVTGNHGQSDFWTIKLDAAGGLVWQKALGGNGEERSFHLIQSYDGSYIVAGYTNSAGNGDVSGNHGFDDFWVVNLAENGNNINWKKCFGGNGYEQVTSIVQTSDSGYIVVGYSDSNDGNATNNYGDLDYWLIKISSTGILQWQKNYGGSGIDIPFAVQLTTDGGFIIAGESNSTNHDVSGNHGSTDFWIVKLSAPIGITENKNNFVASTIFPNPGDEKVTINFSLTEQSLVSIEITDVLGNIIYIEDERLINSGTSYISINSERFKSGVYFFSLKVNKQKVSKKLIIK